MRPAIGSSIERPRSVSRRRCPASEGDPGAPVGRSPGISPTVRHARARAQSLPPQFPAPAIADAMRHGEHRLQAPIPRMSDITALERRLGRPTRPAPRTTPVIGYDDRRSCPGSVQPPVRQLDGPGCPGAILSSGFTSGNQKPWGAHRPERTGQTGADTRNSNSTRFPGLPPQTGKPAARSLHNSGPPPF